MPKQSWEYAADLKNLRKLWGGKCQRCSSKKKLEFAHLAPTGLNGRGRGVRRRYLDIIRHPDSYALFCQSCHRLFDLKLFTWTKTNSSTAQDFKDSKDPKDFNSPPPALQRL